MKKIFFLLMVPFISITSYSQSYFPSGLINVSGGASISYSKSEQEIIGDIKTLEIKFAPAVSYFIIDKLSIGLEVSYNYYEKRIDPTLSFQDFEMFLGFGPVVKYYFLDNNISPFIKIGYSHDIFNITDSYFHRRKYFPGYSVVAGAGFNYFLTDDLALETSLDYSYSLKKKETYSRNSSIWVLSNATTISLNISLSYFL